MKSAPDRARPPQRGGERAQDESLLDRVRALAPLVEAEAETAERDGTLTRPVVEDLFVPDERCFDPQSLPLRGELLFALPLMSAAYSWHMGFGLGVARRALEEVQHVATTNVRLSSQARLLDRPTFQREFAYRSLGAHAVYRSAQIQRCLRDMWTGRQSVAMSDEVWERIGKVRFGLAPSEIML